jgi:hypothetical protein
MDGCLFPRLFVGTSLREESEQNKMGWRWIGLTFLWSRVFIFFLSPPPMTFSRRIFFFSSNQIRREEIHMI